MLQQCRHSSQIMTLKKLTEKRKFMKDKLNKFMQGRYGVDQFARFTLGVALFCIVIGSFLRTGIAGEILDTDAYTGGFNLQIAWSTGRAAGLAAATKQEGERP